MSKLLQEHDPSVRIQQKSNQNLKFNNSYAQALYLSSLSVSRVQLSILYMVWVIGRMAGKPVLQTPGCSVSGGGVEGSDRWNIRCNPCTAPAGNPFQREKDHEIPLRWRASAARSYLLCINIMQHATDIVEGLQLMLMVFKSHDFISSPHLFPRRCYMLRIYAAARILSSIHPSGLKVYGRSDKRNLDFLNR
jgi:hypothetical protein